MPKYRFFIGDDHKEEISLFNIPSLELRKECLWEPPERSGMLHQAEPLLPKRNTSGNSHIELSLLLSLSH